MGIESIRIENFRTCRAVELSNLGHLTVLVGKNGVGKSNILQGIEWGAKMASFPSSLSPSFLDLTACDPGKKKVNIVFKSHHSRYTYNLTLRIDKTANVNHEESLALLEKNGYARELAGRKNEELYDKENEFSAQINKFIPCISAMVALRPLSETNKHILPVLKFFRGIKYYSLNESAFGEETEDSPIHSTFIPHRTYMAWLNMARDIPPSIDSVLMRLLHIYFERRDDFDELTSILSAPGLCVLNGIEIDTTELPAPKGMRLSPESETKIHSIRFLPGQGWEGATTIPKLTYKSLSDGTKRIIRLLVSIFYDKSSVYLFEQPEDGIHPELLKNLIEVLRAYPDKGQIIMASHSSALLDVLRPEEVRLVTMAGGETHVRALSEFDLEGARQFLENQGSLSEYLSLLPEA
jgi:predicted ATPase